MAKKLLLVGGGHAQVFVLEALRQRRKELEGILDVTLVSRDVLTPYSGMLPGLIAGHYRTRECQIDLRPLAAKAGVALVQDRVERLALDSGTAFGQTGEWRFDMASIDIGSSLALSAVPGAPTHAVGVRPVDEFLERWRTLLNRIDDVTGPLHAVVVGGGAGGVELALAMAHRLTLYRDRVKWSLVTRGSLLPGYSGKVVRRMARHLARAGIAVRTDADVVRVDDGSLVFADGSAAAFDALVWATGSSAQAWPAESGLACVDEGFIEIQSTLQSISHPHIFAAGDIATDPRYKRPKAGVFAVRQGPVLAHNLIAQATGQPLRRHRPQPDYLSLLSTGDRHAVASWYGLSWEGDWVWQWKDRIDRQFMQRFSPPFRGR